VIAAAPTELSAERPFPGLRPFGYEDREYFFGRETDNYALYRLIDRNRFIAVVGSSGCGKSSLVRAGFLPLLDDETREGRGRSWRVVTFKPGNAPLERLADALGTLSPVATTDRERTRNEIRRERIGFALHGSSFGLSQALDEIPNLKGTSVLILVDQFEELFRPFVQGAHSDRVTEALRHNVAASFVEQLLQASRDPAREVFIIITMRSDFIGDCAQFPDLPEAVSSAQFLVPSLNRDQRKQVINKPIEKAGASIDSALVETIVNDAGGRVDELPVLQHCLRRMWDDATPPAGAGKRHLTKEHYQHVGTIANALSQHADAILGELPGLEPTVEHVFRALCERDSEGRATRRALSFGELVAETGRPKDEVERVVNRFCESDCSFLVASPAGVLRNDTSIDVGHEALLRRWTKISNPGGWLDAEEADGRFYRAMLALLEH
jgi:energy-coupling factor transporter ATP-binding protein EcfA2